MNKNNLFWISILLLLAISNSAWAATITWTNAAADSNSWCTAGNWNPAQVPGAGDTAIINDACSPQGPTVDCEVTVSVIEGPDPTLGDQVMEIISGSVTVNSWTWANAATTATINISGTSTVTIGGEYWRAPNDGVGIINISGEPTINVAGEIRGADSAGERFFINISGGTLNCDGICWRDNGGGKLTMSGGTINVTNNLRFGGGLPDAGPITIEMTGGQIFVGGSFQCPDGADQLNNFVYLRGGLIDCSEFTHADPDWLLDIEEGIMKIDGDQVATIEADIGAGNITGYGGDSVPTAVYQDGKTIVTAPPPDTNKARVPDPYNGAQRVPVDKVLSWKAGVNADSQEVYFGTDAAAVQGGTGGTYQTTLAPDVNQWDPPLELRTTYYWKIDTLGTGGPWPGSVWEFRTEGAGYDPNLILHYKLDEEDVNTAYDSSGWEWDAVMATRSGGGDWDPDGGEIDGALVFDNDEGLPATVLFVPTEALATIDRGITVTVWLKDAKYEEESGRSGGNNYVFDAGAGGAAGPYHVIAAVPTGDQVVLWRAGDDSNDVMIWGPPFVLEELAGWHHWAFTKDETGAGSMSIYFDGQLADSNLVVADTLSNIQHTPFVVGSCTWVNCTYEGAMDDFRVYNYSLSESEVAAVMRGGDVALAWKPNPYNGQLDAPREAVLTWKPGDYATDHDVYFGTSFDDVNSATTATTAVYKGRQSLDDLDYPAGTLDLDATHYWRIDEVNVHDPNLWKGTIWSFKVAGFLVLDDFEDYDDDEISPQNPINRLYGGPWIDGWWLYDSGSTIYLSYGTDIHRARKAMELAYENEYGGYSEASASTTGPVGLGFQKNWTEDGVKTLTVFFYGDPDNDLEPLYVALSDTPGDIYVSNYGAYGEDLNDITETEWHQWDTPLGDFWDGNNVDINDVNKIYIGLGDRDNPGHTGTGHLYIDDIRLYVPKCVPSLAKPAYDFSGNCIVDIADVRIMADAWLVTDACLPVAPPSPGPVGWWKLDGDANDSSGNNYHGAAQGSYEWLTQGYIDGAIRFMMPGDGKILVPDDGNTPLLRPAAAISATAWVNPAVKQGAARRIVVKGLDFDNRENFAVQVGDDPGWFIRDSNKAIYSAGSDRPTRIGEWTHIAGTYDGSAISFYENGRLANSDANVGAVTLLQDSESLAIGSAVDVNGAFIGAIDDVRVYNYALSAEQVAYIATQSTGGAGTGYMPLLSQTNIYDAEPASQKAVNLRDYAELMNSWLEEKLWPSE